MPPRPSRVPLLPLSLLCASLAGLLVFLAADSVWLMTMSERLYQPAIGHLMRPDPDLWAAAAFYLVYFSGVVGFAVLPAASPRDAWLRGAGFGFVAYATFDLTNQAMMRDWPWYVTLFDLCWGTFVTALGAWVTRRVLEAFTRASSSHSDPAADR